MYAKSDSLRTERNLSTHNNIGIRICVKSQSKRMGNNTLFNMTKSGFLFLFIINFFFLTIGPFSVVRRVHRLWRHTNYALCFASLSHTAHLRVVHYKSPACIQYNKCGLKHFSLNIIFLCVL